MVLSEIISQQNNFMALCTEEVPNCKRVKKEGEEVKRRRSWLRDTEIVFFWNFVNSNFSNCSWKSLVE